MRVALRRSQDDVFNVGGVQHGRDRPDVRQVPSGTTNQVNAVPRPSDPISQRHVWTLLYQPTLTLETDEPVGYLFTTPDFLAEM